MSEPVDPGHLYVLVPAAAPRELWDQEPFDVFPGSEGRPMLLLRSRCTDGDAIIDRALLCERLSRAGVTAVRAPDCFNPTDEILDWIKTLEES